MQVLAGVVLLLLQTSAVVVAGWAVASRLYPTDALARLAATVTLAVALAVLLLEVLGVAGALAPLPVLALSLGLAALGWRSWGIPRGPAPALVAGVRGSVGRSAVLGWLLGASGLLAAAVAADGVVEPRLRFDALVGHLPMAVQWLQTGQLRELPFTAALVEATRYPGNSELMSLWVLIPMHREFLVQLATLPGMAMALAAAPLLTRSLRGGAVAGLVAAALVLTLPPVLSDEVGTNMSDLFAAGGFLIAAAFVARHGCEGSWRDLLIAGVGSGLAVGARYQALLVVAPLLLLALARIRSAGGRRAPALAALAGGLAATGGYWYLRNAVLTGDPFYPATVALPGHTFTGSDYSGGFSGLSWIDLRWSPAAWRHGLGTVLGAWGPVTAVLLAAAVAGPVVALARRRGGLGGWPVVCAAELAAYLATPLSAGPDGAFALQNARYLLPVLLVTACTLSAALWRELPGRAAGVSGVLLGAGLAWALVHARDYADPLLLLLEGVTCAGIAAAVVVVRTAGGGRCRRPWALAAAGVVALITAVPALARVYAHERRHSATVVFRDVADRLPIGSPVDVAGICQVYAFYGEDLRRPVRYLTGAAGIDPPLGGTYERWVEELRAAGVSRLVVGDQRSCYVEKVIPQAGWARTHPEVFRRLWASPDVTLYAVDFGLPVPLEAGR